MADYVVGVDVGTTGAKALLVDVSGAVVARSVHEYPLHTPRPLDRLIADGLATPGRTEKRPRSGRGIAAAGTVSDLVAEQRQ